MDGQMIVMTKKLRRSLVKGGLLRRCQNFVLLSLLLILLSGVSSCKNAFDETADKKSDKSLLFSARQKIDVRDFDGAVTLIHSMSANGQADRYAQDILASAYAGSCGLDFLKFATALGNIGTQTLFQLLLGEMKSGTAGNVASCKFAEAILVGMSARTPDENLLLAFAEFVKIGRIFSVDADTNQDGLVDPAFNSCSSASMSDADTADLGVGITIGLSSLLAASAGVAGGVTGQMSALCTQIDSMVAALGGPYAGYSGFCNKTNPASLSSVELKVFRSLTRSKEIGFASCNDVIGNCLCSPFP
jgi:hypothetical protein